jgi:hypothetical protein
VSYQTIVPFNPAQFRGGPGVPILPSNNGQQDKQVLDYVLYDSKYFVAGTALPTTAIRFFQAQVGAQDVVANSTAVAFTKTYADTNIVQPGQLERGQTMVVRSVEAIITCPSNFDLTVQATGNTTLGLTFPTSAVLTNATAGVISSNLVDAYAKRGCIKLKVGNQYFEQGQLIQFPSSFGLSGFASSAFTGTATAVVVTVPTDGATNNGFGRPRQLLYPRTILAGQNFSIELEFPVSFTPSRNTEIIMCLRGELYRDIS